MNHRIHLLFAMSLAAACSDHGGESVAPAEDAPTQAATPTASAASPAAAAPSPEEPDAAAPTPEVTPPPPPDRMYVVAEGRCRHMGASIVDGRVFVHYVPQPIIELSAEGAPTGFSIDTGLPSDDKVPWPQQLPQIERLGGHFPDHVFAEVLEFAREGIRGVYRKTANGWTPARPFGEAAIERMWPWYDDSLLAFAPWVDNRGPRFGVVRGKPKGPRFDGASKKSGCKDFDMHQVFVQERGDVVATFTCDNRNLFVTHWRTGDASGTTHDLGIVSERRYYDKVGAPLIAADATDGFFVGAESVAGTHHLWHGKDGDWKAIELPSGATLSALATDRKGQPWIAGKTIARRAGEQWIEIASPIGGVSELVGVEYGTPWVRSGSQLARIADDVATEIAIPPSAFFEGERFELEQMHIAGPDDVWAVGTFLVQRRGKGSPGRNYRGLLHSRPAPHPLRCGELTDGGEMKQPFSPWPTATGEGCSQRMLLLLRRKEWDDANAYDKVAKAVKKIAGIETVRFAEIEVGGEKYMVALAPDAAMLEAIKTKTKSLTKYKFPEVVCGDQAVLDAAGVVVHRELDLAPKP